MAMTVALDSRAVMAAFPACRLRRFAKRPSRSLAQSRGAIDASYGLMAMPVALFVVPWPEPHMWPVLRWRLSSSTLATNCSQAFAYTKGAYTVVYPVVRGTGPLFAVFGAYLIFGETFHPWLQWLGRS